MSPSPSCCVFRCNLDTRSGRTRTRLLIRFDPRFRRRERTSAVESKLLHALSMLKSSLSSHNATRTNGQKPDHCSAPCYGMFRRKRRSRRYSPLRFLPFTANAIFSASDTNSVLREKADLHSRRLYGSLLFFHLCDIDDFTVDPKACSCAAQREVGSPHIADVRSPALRFNFANARSRLASC